MSSDCTFSEHINKICQSARNMCSWILRTFKDRHSDLMLTVWKTLVSPILDYCSQLWSPFKKGEIQQIEEIQKSFTRKIRLGQRSDYWERLSALRLYSLERRRERYRIIYIWKILEGIVPNIPSNQNFIRSITSAKNGRSCVIPRIERCSTARVRSLRENSFPINGARLFNILPRSIRNLSGTTLDSFKRSQSQTNHNVVVILLLAGQSRTAYYT